MPSKKLRRVTRRPGGTKVVDTIRDPEVHLRCYVGQDPSAAYVPGALPPRFEGAHIPVVDAALLQAFKDAGTYPAPACLCFALATVTTPHAYAIHIEIDYEDIQAEAPKTVTYVCPLAEAAHFGKTQHGFTLLFTFGAPPDNPEEVASHFHDAGIYIVDVSEDSASGFPSTLRVRLLDETEKTLSDIELAFVHIMPNIELEEPLEETGA